METDIIVLSGGSVKAFLCIGAIQYLVDKNYITTKTNTFIGTSSGSIVAYLLAIGYTPIEMMVHITTNNLFDKMVSFDIPAAVSGNGATSFHHLHEILEKMTILKIGRLITMGELYNDLSKNFICTTYNITKNCKEYLSYENNPNLPCITAIRMSCNLPLVFSHFKYNGSYYIDGGIADNFSVEYAVNNFVKENKKIIGLNLDCSEEADFKPSMNLLEYFYKVLFIPVGENVLNGIENVKKEDKCVVVNLKCNNKKAFDFSINSSDKLNLFSMGYTQIKEYFEEEK